MDLGLRPIVDRGLKLTAVDYVNALVRRNTIWQEASVVFEKFDVLATPTVAVPPFAVGRDRPAMPAGPDDPELR